MPEENCELQGILWDSYKTHAKRANHGIEVSKRLPLQDFNKGGKREIAIQYGGEMQIKKILKISCSTKTDPS